MKTNGTAIGNERWEYTWDADNRLIQVKKDVYTSSGSPAARYHVTDYGESSYGFSVGLENEFTVTYDYDQMGRMLRRDDGTNVTTFEWDNWDLLSETTGAVTTDYLVPNGLIYSFIRDGETYTAMTDGLGSIRMVTDSDGEVVARNELDAWGRQLDGSFDDIPGGVPFGFIGGLGVRFDATTGLHYMRNRWYSSEFMRFLNRDPIGLVGGSNMYAYCENAPLDFVDPFGLDIKPSKELTPQERAFYEGAMANLKKTAKGRKLLEQINAKKDYHFIVRRYKGDKPLLSGAWTQILPRDFDKNCKLKPGTYYIEIDFSVTGLDPMGMTGNSGLLPAWARLPHELGHVEHALYHPAEFIKAANDFKEKGQPGAIPSGRKVKIRHGADTGKIVPMQTQEREAYPMHQWEWPVMIEAGNPNVPQSLP